MLRDVGKLAFDLLGATAEISIHELSGQIVDRIVPRAARNQAVLTIPGFMSTDESLQRLNRFLQKRGFNARSWGLGRNRLPEGASWGAHLDNVQRQLMEKVRELSDQTSQKVALVGHSLGGVLARELAHRMENEIDRVITLGAPTIHPYRSNSHNKVINTLSGWINRQSTTELGGRAGLLHWDAEHPQLPCVAIHSPFDGFVNECECHIPGYIVAQATAKSPRENVRVVASHSGMTSSVWVLIAVADRLNAQLRRWRPFDPEPLFPVWLRPLARSMYPNADALWADRGVARFMDLHR